MFNVGGGELLVVLLIALIVLGPDRLPEYSRKVAKVAGELRRLSNGFQAEMRQAMDFTDDTPVVQPPAAPAEPVRLDPPPAVAEPIAGPEEESSAGDSSAA